MKAVAGKLVRRCVPQKLVSHYTFTQQVSDFMELAPRLADPPVSMQECHDFGTMGAMLIMSDESVCRSE